MVHYLLSYITTGSAHCRQYLYQAFITFITALIWHLWCSGAVCRRDKQDEETCQRHQQATGRLNDELEKLQEQLKESSKTQLQH